MHCIRRLTDRARISDFQDSLSQYILFFGLFILYLFLPTNNSTIDGWGFACDIKYGEFLFKPHHLLYNATGWLILKLASLFTISPDVLSMMKVLNGFAGLGCLIIFRKILIDLKISNVEYWILIVGSSFGVMRFATENETYLIPILLSFLSGFWMLKYFDSAHLKSLILSGLLASLACLYHQIQIIWWIGFLIILAFHKPLKANLIYLSTALLMPLVYGLVLVFYENQDLTFLNLSRYVLHDYLQPEGTIDIGAANFLLTPINLFRTFFQVHGNIFYLVKLKPLFFIPGLLGLSLFILAIFRIRFANARSDRSESMRLFGKSILYIFILQLTFAFISDGNAEFMVILPFFIPVILSCWGELNRSFLKLFGAALLLWNVSFGLLPAHYFSFYDHEGITSYIKEHPYSLYILEDRHIVINQYYYRWGLDISQKTYPYPIGDHYEEICQIQGSGTVIITDALSRINPMNRKRIVNRSNPSFDFRLIRHKLAISSLYGPYFLDQVYVRCDPIPGSN